MSSLMIESYNSFNFNIVELHFAIILHKSNMTPSHFQDIHFQYSQELQSSLSVLLLFIIIFFYSCIYFNLELFIILFISFSKLLLMPLVKLI